MERIGEAHIGVRFGDHAKGVNWKVVLDGEDVTNNATEALGGENGWVDVIRGRKDHVVQRKYGNVEISSVPRE